MNSKKISKFTRIGVLVLGLIGAVMLVRVFVQDEDALSSDAALQASVLDPFVSYTIMMLYLTAILAVGFSIWNLVKNPVMLKKTLISVGVLLVLFFLAYAMASDAEITGANGVYIEGGEAGSIPKRVGALIKYTYILGIIGLGVVVWGAVKGMFSNN